MGTDTELKQAVLAEREAARKYEAARRADKDQRRKKASRPEELARACGL